MLNIFILREIGFSTLVAFNSGNCKLNQSFKSISIETLVTDFIYFNEGGTIIETTCDNYTRLAQLLNIFN